MRIAKVLTVWVAAGGGRIGGLIFPRAPWVSSIGRRSDKLNSCHFATRSPSRWLGAVKDGSRWRMSRIGRVAREVCASLALISGKGMVRLCLS